MPNLTKNWSISGRLSLLFTLSTLSMLMLFMLFSYWALDQILTNANFHFLTDEIRVLRHILQKYPASIAALEEEVKWSPEEAADSRYRYFAHIMSAAGETITETEDMKTILRGAQFPTPAALNERPTETSKWISPSGKVYLLMSAWSKGETNSGTSKRLIEIALDVSQQYQALAIYRRNLALVFFIGTVIAAGLGIFITRKGMHALKNITNAAEHITVNQLHTRINLSDWPNELNNLALAFNKMLQRIEDAFARLSHFSAELAHELRTPINNLMGEAEITLSRKRSVAEYQQVLESSLEEYNRLSRMIENILFLARADDPHTCINPVRLDIKKELEAIREFHEAVAAEKNIQIICHGESVLEADPLLFRRAISNLLYNALKHTPSGGRITINTTYTEQQQNQITITDTGEGIAAEDLPRVFDRFYRVKENHSMSHSGFGLGLSIVKSIMALHQGTISISSILNQGTMVILLFPCKHN